MTKTPKTCTAADTKAFWLAKSRIEAIRANIVALCPDLTASEWQFQATVTCEGLRWSRINRLVALGLLESKPSDGFGPSVRVGPNFARYL